MKTKLLFICSGNIDRSPCASEIINKDFSEKFEARSGGVGPLTENPVTKEMIDWADKIFVMEDEHKWILLKNFPEVEDVNVLNIPNTFLRYDVELESVLREKLGNWMEKNKSEKILGLI